MELSLRANLSYMKIPAPSPERRSKYSGQSVRAIPVRILTVGKRRSQGIQLLVDEYKEKLKYYCSFEDIHIRSNPKNTGNVKTQIEAEDMIVMQHIRPEDWVVVLDERGADIGSEQMANLVGDVGRTINRINVIKEYTIENGHTCSCRQRSVPVEARIIKGSSRLAFCIGGPYGHGPQVRQRADITIRLSSMVLNHQIALVVLLEQLYRHEL